MFHDTVFKASREDPIGLFKGGCEDGGEAWAVVIVEDQVAVVGTVRAAEAEEAALSGEGKACEVGIVLRCRDQGEAGIKVWVVWMGSEESEGHDKASSLR